MALAILVPPQFTCVKSANPGLSNVGPCVPVHLGPLQRRQWRLHIEITFHVRISIALSTIVRTKRLDLSRHVDTQASNVRLRHMPDGVRAWSLPKRVGTDVQSKLRCLAFVATEIEGNIGRGYVIEFDHLRRFCRYALRYGTCHAM